MSRMAGLAASTVALSRGRVESAAVVLGYHDVVRAGATGLAVTASRLRAHIRLLRRFGLSIVPLDELRRRLVAGSPTDGLAVLTFDDGLVGVHRHGLEVLAEEGAPATVFVVSGADGVAPPWWAGAARTMTRAELLDVHAAGLGLATHTRTHPSLPELSDADLHDELVGGRAAVEGLIGTPVRALAYPFGHHDARVRAAVWAAGFDVACTFLNGRIDADVDNLRVPRLTMTASHTTARLAYHLTRPARSWPNHQHDAVGTRVMPT